MQDYKNYKAESSNDRSNAFYIAMSMVLIVIVGIAGRMELNDSTNKVKQVPKPACEIIGGDKVCGRKANDF